MNAGLNFRNFDLPINTEGHGRDLQKRISVLSTIHKFGGALRARLSRQHHHSHQMTGLRNEIARNILPSWISCNETPDVRVGVAN